MTTTILATVQAKPELTVQVLDALKNMILPTRAEAGCVSYTLYQSEEEAATFCLLETYVSDEALASHHQSPHFAELLTCLEDKLSIGIQIKRLSTINVLQPMI